MTTSMMKGKRDRATLAGAAKTLVVSMLSERVVLRVLLMLAEWVSAKSTTSLDDKIVTEIRSKLEADGKL